LHSCLTDLRISREECLYIIWLNNGTELHLVFVLFSVLRLRLSICGPYYDRERVWRVCVPEWVVGDFSSGCGRCRCGVECYWRSLERFGQVEVRHALTSFLGEEYRAMPRLLSLL
jgi:hypothetical protein